MSVVSIKYFSKSTQPGFGDNLQYFFSDGIGLVVLSAVNEDLIQVTFMQIHFKIILKSERRILLENKIM